MGILVRVGMGRHSDRRPTSSSSSSSAFIGHIQQFEYSAKGGFARERERERKEEREKEKERGGGGEREDEKDRIIIIIIFREGHYLQWGEDYN